MGIQELLCLLFHLLLIWQMGYDVQTIRTFPSTDLMLLA
jgi:hypothetical protein